MRVLVKSRQCKKAVFTGKLVWLKAEIAKHFHTRENISVHLKVIHSELVYRLHPAEFEVIWRDAHEKAANISFQQYQCQNKKLKIWMQQQTASKKSTNFNGYKFHPRVINFSSVELTQAENNLLNKGLGYAPYYNITNKELVDLALHVDCALSEDDLEGKVECAKIIKNASSSNYESSEPSIVSQLNKKVVDHSLIITKADKGSTVCILNKTDYIDKMQDTLSKMNLKEINEDPTKKYNKITTQIINKNKLIFDERKRSQVKMNNPTAPVVYGLLKIHKENMPLRPVSSAFNAPTQKLGKELSKILPEILEFNSNYSIKNTNELVDKLKTLNIPPNAKLVSFDICNLFPSVPINKLKTILYDRIREKICDINKRKQLIELIDLCLDQNYFYFNGKFYIQSDGLAMGASLSPFMAEFYVNYLEQKIFENCDIVNKILCWYRYVDDVFCIWTGSLRQLDNFVNNTLNKIDDNIKFTTEFGGQQINFLDVSINICNQKLEFGIYRKETASDIVIPHDSNHPYNIKMAAFHSMLNRLINIPLNKNKFKDELNKILQIAVNNGYTKSCIYNLLKKKSKKTALKLAYPSEVKKVGNWRKIPYIKGISDKIRIPLKKRNILPAFFTNRTLKNLILNNKLRPKINEIEKSGVYKVSCNDCDAVYIGKTKRSLKIRYAEHISSAKHNRPASGLAKHLIETGHSTSINNIALIHNLSGGKLLDRYELFEIKAEQKKGSFLINDQQDFSVNSPLFNFESNSK